MQPKTRFCVPRFRGFFYLCLNAFRMLLQALLKARIQNMLNYSFKFKYTELTLKSSNFPQPRELLKT